MIALHQIQVFVHSLIYYKKWKNRVARTKKMQWRQNSYIVFRTSIHIMVILIINTTETCSIAWIKESLHSYVLNVLITSREGIEFINHNDGSTLRVSRKRRPSRTKVENQKISFFHVLGNHKIDSKSHELGISAKGGTKWSWCRGCLRNTFLLHTTRFQ
jgi:hypothetical protein